MSEFLTIALTKGRLAYRTLELLEKVGISCQEMKDKQSRKLIFINEELGVRFFLAKANDVPTYVEYGGRGYRHLRQGHHLGGGAQTLRGP